jgi:formamidopyrimidine-DNA glycosylase
VPAPGPAPPTPPAATLTSRELTRSHHAVQTTLGEAIDHGGPSFTDYVNQARGHGGCLANARVFHRDGQPCPAGGTLIEPIRVGRWGTNVCPRCQPPNQ